MQLNEGLQYKDLEGMLKPTIHIDEFASKMGDDDNIVVVSFYVRDSNAAQDLVNWFEKGYDFVVDADRSPGEIKPNRYLVYIEMYRRNKTANNIAELLDDLTTLTEFASSDWIMKYQDHSMPFTIESFNGRVPTTPAEYRQRKEKELNEMRSVAGLPNKQVYERRADVRAWQALARI